MQSTQGKVFDISANKYDPRHSTLVAHVVYLYMSKVREVTTFTFALAIMATFFTYSLYIPTGRISCDIENDLKLFKLKLLDGRRPLNELTPGKQSLSL